MTRAAEFLRDTDLAIDDIATRVGYESLPSFIRAVVRFRVERPGAYRKSARARTPRLRADAALSDPSLSQEATPRAVRSELPERHFTQERGVMP
ncbi:helix-turn-helix domain-containing protein [Myxococcus xanthus]|uniref:helix-turn-helix domain-containing protein n=1 Tax=Myxococcus xanthus TaxID=34 RepID=UPI003004411C